MGQGTGCQYAFELACKVTSGLFIMMAPQMEMFKMSSSNFNICVDRTDVDFKPIKNCKSPILILHGQKDEVVDIKVIEKFREYTR